MKFIYKWLVVLALSLPLAIQAGQVTINTEDSEGTYELKFSEYTEAFVSPSGDITINGTDYLSGTLPVFSGGVSCGEGTEYQAEGNQCVVAGQSSSSSSSSSSTPSSCGPLPNNVQLTDITGLSDWGTSGTMNEFRIPNGKILSRKVSTGSNPDGASRVKLFGESGTSSDRRRLWISDCPGGDAISRPSCRYPVRAGTNVEILWTQSNLGALYCDLGTNNDYYLNISTNATCHNGGCWARSQHYLINPID